MEAKDYKQILINDRSEMTKEDYINTLDHYTELVENEKMGEGWISVEDRLPDNTDDVLMFFDVDQGYISMVFYEDNQWDSVDEYPIDKPGTHWMPLPEIPKQ